MSNTNNTVSFSSLLSARGWVAGPLGSMVLRDLVADRMHIVCAPDVEGICDSWVGDTNYFTGGKQNIPFSAVLEIRVTK